MRQRQAQWEINSVNTCEYLMQVERTKTAPAWDYTCYRSERVGAHWYSGNTPPI